MTISPKNAAKQSPKSVGALTQNNTLPERKKYGDYHRRLRDADWRARLIKLADQFDNYSDTILGLKEGPSDVREKCKAAIELAQADVKKHAETARAVELLRKLMKKKSADR